MSFTAKGILAAGARSLALILVVAIFVPARVSTAESRGQTASQVTVAPAPPTPKVRAIEELFFEVRPVGSRERLASLRPGEAFTLQEGTEVEVIAVARPAGGRDGDLFRPKTRFWLEGGDRDELSFVAVTEERGAVTLRALAPDRRAPDRDVVLHWQVTEALQAPRGLRSGTLRVRIEPAPGTAREALSERQAREVWSSLYRAILLREPDTFDGVERLRREGYPALLEQARAIAASDESAIGVYGRGACNEQRLLALYRHFWGLSDSQIPRDQWERDLDLLHDRRYADVVAAFLQSDLFLRHNGLDAEVRRAVRRPGGR
jgi:hypothetical protein